MTDRERDTPTDRQATFALLRSLREVAQDQETRADLARVEDLALRVLGQDVGAHELLAEELGVAR